MLRRGAPHARRAVAGPRRVSHVRRGAAAARAERVEPPLEREDVADAERARRRLRARPPVLLGRRPRAVGLLGRLAPRPPQGPRAPRVRVRDQGHGAPRRAGGDAPRGGDVALGGPLVERRRPRLVGAGLGLRRRLVGRPERLGQEDGLEQQLLGHREGSRAGADF